MFDYTDADGKRHYKSFTAASKKEAEYAAAEYSLTKADHRNNTGLTFGDALDGYIEKRSSILSPATIREYKRSRRAIYRS